LIDPGEYSLGQEEGDKSDAQQHKTEAQEQLGPDPQWLVHAGAPSPPALKAGHAMGTFTCIG
jgi:hypothetical protein